MPKLKPIKEKVVFTFTSLSTINYIATAEIPLPWNRATQTFFGRPLVICKVAIRRLLGYSPATFKISNHYRKGWIKVYVRRVSPNVIYGVRTNLEDTVTTTGHQDAVLRQYCPNDHFYIKPGVGNDNPQ